MSQNRREQSQFRKFRAWAPALGVHSSYGVNTGTGGCFWRRVLKTEQALATPWFSTCLRATGDMGIEKSRRNLEQGGVALFVGFAEADVLINHLQFVPGLTRLLRNSKLDGLAGELFLVMERNRE